jgi:hypothetical protein
MKTVFEDGTRHPLWVTLAEYEVLSKEWGLRVLGFRVLGLRV